MVSKEISSHMATKKKKEPEGKEEVKRKKDEGRKWEAILLATKGTLGAVGAN